MSADHRKPVVAFVALAFLAAALVGVQRADAQTGRFMAAVLGGDAHAQGHTRVAGSVSRDTASALPEVLTLASGGPTTSATRQATGPDVRRARVSRGHDRHDLTAPADRHSTHGSARPGAAGERGLADEARPAGESGRAHAGRADQAAEQAHAAVSKPMPEHAVAKGRASSDERRPAPSGSNR